MRGTRWGRWVGISTWVVLNGCDSNSPQVDTARPADSAASSSATSSIATTSTTANTASTDAGRDVDVAPADSSEPAEPDASTSQVNAPSNSIPETEAENTEPPAQPSAPSMSQTSEPVPANSQDEEPPPTADETDAGSPAGQLDAGRTTQPRTVRLQVDAPETEEPQLFGDVVAGVDDVDGDGWADFVASSLLETVTFDGGVFQGRVRVYSGFDGRVLYELTNPDPQEQQPDALFGHSLLWLDDLDGDGIGEIAVGARRYDSEARLDAGRVYVFNGADGSLVRALVAPDGAGWFGAGMQLGEYFDGDYERELLVAGLAGTAAYLVSPVSGEAIVTFESPVPRTAFFGQGIAYLGDIDGDETGDVAISDYSASDPPEAGRVHLYSGTGALITTLEGDDTRFGFGIAAIGDVDGDGANDLAIDHETGVDVVSGAEPETTLYTVPSEDFFFGERILALPDQDCDAVGDFAVAARDNMGAVFIYSGASGEKLPALEAPELPTNARFGRYMGLLEHPMDRGIELLVTATGANENRGAVFMFTLNNPAACPEHD